MTTEGAVLGILRAARPQLRSAHDRVAFVVHAIFQSAGYSLIAVGSRVPSEVPDGDEEATEVGIDGWNDMHDAYAFLYSGAGHEGLSKFALVKCLAVEDMLVVAATADNDTEPLLFELRVSDYVTVSEGPNYGKLYTRLNELVEQVNSVLLSKLCAKDKPVISRNMKATKDSYIEEIDYQPSILVDESATSMRGNRYPSVPSLGSDDLMPGGAAGVFPHSVDPGGGGMLLGPNDPRWGSMGHGEFPFAPDGERGVVPPGARYDPVGPPGVPGFEPGRFVRGRRPSGGLNPDLEHFSPF